MRVVRMALAAMAAAATTLVVMPALPASAGVPTNPADIMTLTVRVEGATGTVAHGFLFCPDGMLPVSGGVTRGEFTSLTPLQGGTGYSADGLIIAQPPNNNFLLTLNCANASLITNVTSWLSSSPTRQTTMITHTFTCPNGGFAFAGGGQLSGHDATRMMSNLPTADGHGWTFSGVKPRAGGSARVGLSCFDAPSSGLRAWIAESVQEFRADEMGTAVGNCTGGVALAGGVAILDSAGNPSAPATITRSQWDGINWLGSGLQRSAPRGTKLVVRALCVARL